MEQVGKVEAALPDDAWFKLPASATAAQRAAYELTYVLDERSNVRTHKAQMMANAQRQAFDAKPGAGRLSRYSTVRSGI